MLSKLSTLILGALREEARSPYEIIALFKNLEVTKWFPVADSTVYSTVKKLKQMKFVESRLVKSGKLPAKTIYSLTPLGEQELLKTASCYLDSVETNLSGFQVGILLMDLFKKEEVLKKLRTKLEGLEKIFFDLKKQILAMERNQQSVPFSTIAVLKYKYYLIEAERKTLKELIRGLNLRRGRKRGSIFDFRLPA